METTSWGLVNREFASTESSTDGFKDVKSCICTWRLMGLSNYL